VVHLKFRFLALSISVQILVQGRISGAKELLLAPAPEALDRADQEALITGRSRWLSLLTEVLPRALIAELGLSRMLVGASGGEQFLVILPEEARQQAHQFLRGAADAIREMSAATLQLVFASTEELGDWTIVRRRLNEEMTRSLSTPLAAAGAAAFDQQPLMPTPDFDSYFISDMGRKLRDTPSVSWSPEKPALILPGDQGRHNWPVGTSANAAAPMDAIPLARQEALSDDGQRPATTLELAARAHGRHLWGVLRGDVDNFGIRVRRMQAVEEHVNISVLYKQFFAGELEVLCSMPEFWSRVTLLYSGGEDFAVFGAWDALIALAREIHRVFERFTQENLRDFPGPEGKTLTMALSIAPDEHTTLAEMYESAGERLSVAKTTDKDCFWLLGRTLEWKQVGDAAEVRNELTRMITEFGAAPEYLRDLAGLYRETRRNAGPRRPDRPWRLHRRLNRILGTQRTREFQKARAGLAADLASGNAANMRMRPSGRVALEWARLLTEDQTSTPATGPKTAGAE